MPRVLLLASYCDDVPTCTDDLPCLDCLKMCNIVTISGKKTDNIGGWDFNRELADTGLPRAEAEQKLVGDSLKQMSMRRLRGTSNE